MFKIQKALNMIKDGDGGKVFIKPSNIKKNQILDRDVIDNFVKQTTDDSVVLQECLNNLSDTTNSSYNINETMYNISLNKIRAINKLLNVNKDINDVFMESFENCKNIDMSSDAFINFTNNYCSLPYKSTKHVNLKSVLVYNDSNHNSKYISSMKNNFIDDMYSYSILNSKSKNATITLELELEPSNINEIRLSCSSANTCSFSLYYLNTNNQYINICNLETNSNPIFVFNSVYTSKIKIIIYKSYDYSINSLYNYSIILNSINVLCNTFKTNATLISKPFKLYGNTNNIIATLKSNSDTVDCYIGLMDKNNNTTWYNGNLPIDTNISIETTSVINKTYSKFYTVDNQDLYSIFELTNKINTNSIKVFSGYNKYKITTIENAVINDDLTYVQYSQENIVSNIHSDIQDCKINISSNQLSIITAKFILEEDMCISIPFIEATDEDVDLITSIRVNGKAVNSSVSDNKYNVLCKKGLNSLSVLCYLKDDAYGSTITTNVDIPINLIAYSDFIYTSEMLQVPYYDLLLGKSDSSFTINSNNVYVNTNINKDTDQYLLQYTYVSDSDKLYNDFDGNYLKCVYKLKLNSNNEYKNVFVKSIEIYSK